jgi:hypothetical protein
MYFLDVLPCTSPPKKVFAFKKLHCNGASPQCYLGSNLMMQISEFTNSNFKFKLNKKIHLEY